MAHCYDIVWTDGQSARKVTPDAIASQGWRLNTGRVDPLECNRLWMQHLLDRCNKLAAAASQRKKPSGAPLAQHQRKPLAPESKPVIDSTRPVSAQARLLLAHAVPGIAFSVLVEHKKLSVAWLDGPAEITVESALAPLVAQGSIKSASIRRGANLPLVQAAIDHVLGKLWGDENSSGAQADRMRLTPEDFQRNLLATAVTPPACAMGAVPYNTLIRCVIDRWDDCLSRFVDTPRTRYLIQERAFLFPLGDDLESGAFRSLIYQSTNAREDAKNFVNTLSSADRQRG